MADPQYERQLLQTAMQGGKLERLVALRDYIADQLEANMCPTCRISKLTQGSQATLIDRLEKITDEIEAIQAKSSDTSRLAEVRALHSVAGEGQSLTDMFSPSARRQASGTRRPGGGRRPSEAS